MGNSPVTREFPAHRASNAENVSIWWRHHENQHTTPESGSIGLFLKRRTSLRCYATSINIRLKNIPLRTKLEQLDTQTWVSTRNLLSEVDTTTIDLQKETIYNNHIVSWYNMFHLEKWYLFCSLNVTHSWVWLCSQLLMVTMAFLIKPGVVLVFFYILETCWSWGFHVDMHDAYLSLTNSTNFSLKIHKSHKSFDQFDFRHLDEGLSSWLAIVSCFLHIINIVAQWRHMATFIWINVGSGNSLLPDGAKPLPESMLTYHQWVLEKITRRQFHERYLSHQSLKLAQGPMSLTS